MGQVKKPHAKSYTTEENERIRAAVVKLLADCGSNQTELARQLGITQSSVSLFLSGRNGAGPQLAQAVADHLGISREELTSGKPGRVVEFDLPERPTSPYFGDDPRWPAAEAQAIEENPHIPPFAFKRARMTTGGARPSVINATVVKGFAEAWMNTASREERVAALRAQVEEQMRRRDAEYAEEQRLAKEAEADSALPPRVIEPVTPPPPSSAEGAKGKKGAKGKDRAVLSGRQPALRCRQT